MLFVRCLSWRHPLQRSALVGGGNLDLNVNSLALWYLGWEGDGQRAAVRLYPVANAELDALALNLYNRDIEIAEFVSSLLPTF